MYSARCSLGLFLVKRSEYALLLIAIATTTVFAQGGTAPLNVFGTSTAPITIQARSADKFVDSMGINVHMESSNPPYSDYGLINAELPLLGMRHFRDEINDTDGSFVGEMNYIGTLGYSLCGLIEGGNDYPGFKKRLQAGKVVPMIRNLLPTIDAVEGPNEPDDNPPLFEYDGVCTSKEKQACYPLGAIQESEDLWHIVKHSSIAGSDEIRHLPLLGMSEGTSKDFLRLAAALKGKPFPQATYGNMHAYQGGSVGDAGLRTAYILNAQAFTGADKPLWTTEMGYHNYTKFLSDGEQQGVSERAAAIYLPIAFLSGFNNNVLRTFSYELNDEVDDPHLTHKCGPSPSQIDYCSGEGHYGLLNFDGSPKPAFTAIKNLIELLQEPGSKDFKPGSLMVKFEGAPNTMEYTLLQKSNGDYYLAIWNDKQVYQPATATSPGVDQNPKKVPVTISFCEPHDFTVYAPNDTGGTNLTDSYTLSTTSDSIELDLPAQVLLVKIVGK
jgi:hypothetical protein